MTDAKYLPVKESLGYKNVKKALWNVFSANLDDFEITEGEYENFGFQFRYKAHVFDMGLSSTGKGIQFECGEGGLFTIALPNPTYPKESFLKSVFFHHLLTDMELRDEVRYVFGKKEGAIERALFILKQYIDSIE